MYDPSGKPTQETLPGGDSRVFEYDGDGNLVAETGTTDGVTSARTFEYDALGRVVAFHHPEGRQSVTYDALSRVVSTEGPAGDSHYTYDRDGNVLSRTDASGTTTFAWDSSSRMTKVTLPDSTERTYTYKGAERGQHRRARRH